MASHINKHEDSDKKRFAMRDISHSFTVVKLLFSVMIKEKPALVLIFIVKMSALAAQPVLPMLIQAPLIDELLKGSAMDVQSVYTLGIIFLLVSATPWIVMNVLNQVKEYYKDWFNLYFERRLSEKCMNIDFHLTEDPETLSLPAKALEGINMTGGVIGILSQVEQLCANFIIIVSIMIIVITGTPLLLVVQLISLILLFVINNKINRIEADSRMMQAKINRGFSYFFWQITDYIHAKDIRLYGAKDMMYSKCGKYIDDVCEIWNEKFHKKIPFNFAVNSANAVSDGICYLYIGTLAFRKIITPGGFTLYLSTTASFMNAVLSSARVIQDILTKCAYAYSYIEFMELPSASENKGSEVIPDTAPTIEFKNVSFKYPRSDSYALKNVNITIPPGQRLSIVGQNGAGKTTFIKLLCRLYKVTEGEILLNGININNYSDTDYRKLIAVVFQDFSTFAFSLKENIAFSNDVHDDDIYSALEKSGMSRSEAEKISLSTPIAKSFDENAIDISGGQKQKCALARAVFKNSPLIILDEPTAALDPIAEYEIYKNFNSLINNKIALYISHRLSSCKFCDVIAVFSQNTISEYGSHSALLKNNSTYAKMWSAQAKYYT
ncbi:MAG: ABC transporter ATP-binding protein/permease [Ruminococcus sp.]|jgi:ATP-binding cassette subfamily C protein|nr:ABC transporter ATP-binding protein/permease [Ruminococcus sp.]